MGFYLRKAISVGPLRFNLSKSGVGVSAGIRGLRLGSGPRGHYVHMGRNGLYFRKTLRSGEKGTAGRPPQPTPQSLAPGRTTDVLADIDSGDVRQMIDSSAMELLEELNTKSRMTRLVPIAVVLGAVLVGSGAYLVNQGQPWWVAAVFGIAAVVIVILAHLKDQLRKTVVVLYDLEPAAADRYQKLHDAFETLRQVGRLWHVEAAGGVRERKYHAGATTVVARSGVSLASRSIPHLRTNVEIPVIPVGRQLLAFMPDRLLVFDSKVFGAVPYSDLVVDVQPSRFIEGEALPRDAQVVGQTWKYVNKQGGPDRRFEDNRELPVVLYEELRFSSTSGLNEVIQVSRSGAALPLKGAVHELSQSGAEQPGRSFTE